MSYNRNLYENFRDHRNSNVIPEEKKHRYNGVPCSLERENERREELEDLKTSIISLNNKDQRVVDYSNKLIQTLEEKFRNDRNGYYTETNGFRYYPNPQCCALCESSSNNEKLDNNYIQVGNKWFKRCEREGVVEKQNDRSKTSFEQLNEPLEHAWHCKDHKFSCGYQSMDMWVNKGVHAYDDIINNDIFMILNSALMYDNLNKKYVLRISSDSLLEKLFKGYTDISNSDYINVRQPIKNPFKGKNVYGLMTYAYLAAIVTVNFRIKRQGLCYFGECKDLEAIKGGHDKAIDLRSIIAENMTPIFSDIDNTGIALYYTSEIGSDVDYIRNLAHDLRTYEYNTIIPISSNGNLSPMTIENRGYYTTAILVESLNRYYNAKIELHKMNDINMYLRNMSSSASMDYLYDYNYFKASYEYLIVYAEYISQLLDNFLFSYRINSIKHKYYKNYKWQGYYTDRNRYIKENVNMIINSKYNEILREYEKIDTLVRQQKIMFDNVLLTEFNFKIARIDQVVRLINKEINI